MEIVTINNGIVEYKGTYEFSSYEEIDANSFFLNTSKGQSFNLIYGETEINGKLITEFSDL